MKKTLSLFLVLMLLASHSWGGIKTFRVETIGDLNAIHHLDASGSCTALAGTCTGAVCSDNATTCVNLATSDMAFVVGASNDDKWLYDSTDTGTEDGSTIVQPDSLASGSGRWLLKSKTITATERTNYGSAYTHSQAAHAPIDAEANNISDANATDLTDGGVTTLHSHTGGGGTWGSILGTLADQTDLQAAIDAKSAIGHGHTGTYEPANANIQSHIADTADPHDTIPPVAGNDGKFLSLVSGEEAWVAVPGGGDLLSTNNLSDLSDNATARTNLGLAIGTDVQAWSAILDATTAAYTSANATKLAGIETAATADQTGAEIKTAYENEPDTNALTDALLSKLNGIEASADVNNISDAYATDLTDAGDSILHYHATDRARADHTGTQAAATISDFDTEVANNSAVAANTAKISFDSTSSTKLSGIEAGAEINNISDANATDLTDGGTTILHDHGGQYNAIYYGVDTTDANDDTTTIQAAIDAVYAAGGGEIYIDAGTLWASVVTLKTGVTLVGAGKDVTTIKQIASSDQPFILATSMSTKIGLRSLTVDMDKTNQTGPDNAVSFQWSGDVIVRDVRVTNATDHGMSFSNGSGATIENSEFDNNVGSGVFLYKYSKATATNIHSHHNTESGLDNLGDGPLTNDDIVVIDSRFNNNTLQGISSPRYPVGYVPYVNRMVISGNICTDNGEYGIAVFPQYGTIINNIANDNGISGIIIASEETIVTGNTASNNASVGIDTGWARKKVVTGNTVTNNGYFGIEINVADDMIVNNNYLEDNCQSGTDYSICAAIVIKGNTIYDDYTYTERVITSGNLIGSSSGIQHYGIQVNVHSNDIVLTGNNVKNSGTLGDIRIEHPNYIESNNLVNNPTITPAKYIHNAIQDIPAESQRYQNMITSGTFSGSVDTYYVIDIDGATTFRWSDDGGSTWDASTVAITGAAQTLNNGVQVTFQRATGQTIGDKWNFVASAQTIAIPDTGDKFIIADAGLDTIDSVRSHSDTYPNSRTITLTFLGAKTIEDGTGNLELNGDLVTATGTTLTLVGNSTNSKWYEVSRNTTPPITLGTDTSGNYVSSATASQGLTVTGTEGASVGLQTCTDGQIIKNSGGTSWACASDDTGGSPASDSITPDMLLSTGQTDEYCMTYEATGDTWEWQTCGAGGGSGSVTTVKESDTPVGDADIVTLDFGAGFDVAETPDTEIQITFDPSEIAGHDLFTDFVANEHIDWTSTSDALYTASTLRGDSGISSQGSNANTAFTASGTRSGANIFSNNATFASSQAYQFGFDNDYSVAPTGNVTQFYSTQNFPRVSGSYNIGTYYGSYNGLRTESGYTGTISNMYNVASNQPYMAGTSATITNLYGFYADGNGASSDTVVNNYAFYAEDQTAGSSANYAFYAAGTTATNYFGGPTTLNSTVTANSAVNISGELATSGSAYFKLQYHHTSAPTAADCDSDDERGRMKLETTNNRLYICNGATRGWDYITLTN